VQTASQNNHAFDTTFIESSSAEADNEDGDDDEDDEGGDDLSNDPDWVSGLTPGGPQRTSTLRAKVGHSW